MRTLSAVAFLLTMAVSDCGRIPVQDIAPEFREYTARFEVLGHLKIGDLKAKFGTLRGNTETVGLCVVEEDGTPPSIVIDRDYWYEAGDLQREELMFHELGHCVLNRDHLNDLNRDRCPKSLMYWQTIERDCLEDHHADYMKEMFAGRS
jgi:hypothetical protein